MEVVLKEELLVEGALVQVALGEVAPPNLVLLEVK